VDSRYGSIVVTRRGAIHDFFQSGALAHTIPDPLAAEESVHIPLLYHPDPEKVLIIGGAGSGVVSETVRHPSVTALDIVELDPEVLEITRRYAPDDWMESSRVAVHPIYGDGRAYVASTGRTYDVVIVNVGMPASLQVNRYYTLEFFRQVNRVLEPGGILALALPSPGSFISPEVASLVASVVRSVRQVFARVDILPGDTIHIIASRDLDLRQRSQVMIETMQARDLNTSYVNQYRLWERLVPLERARIDSLVAKYSSVPANTDYRPVSASFAIDRWARHFASGRLLSELAARVNVGSSVAFIVLAGLVVSALIMLLTRSSVTAFPAALMVYSVGVTTMFSQILIVLCFQIVSGFMYGRIAGLVAAFMLGMGLASTLAGRGNVRRRHGLLLAFQIMLAALPLIVVGAFKVVGESVLATTAVPEIVFPCLALFGGAVGGTVFAGGSGWISEAHSEVAEAGAAAYSIDLLGAAGAGFAAGLLAIPAMGLAGSAYAVSTANLILLVPALIGRRAHRKSLPH
jgi:spermidine synthase